MTTDLREPTEEEIETVLERPSNFGYHGDLPLFNTWGLTGPGQSRDSDPLERANFDAVYDDLSDQYPDQCDIIRSNHWAVGWVEQIAVKVLDENGDPTDCFKYLLSIKDALFDYPVYDEARLYRYEFEEACDIVDIWIPTDADVEPEDLLRELAEQYNIYEDEFLYGSMPDIEEDQITDLVWSLHYQENPRTYPAKDLDHLFERYPEAFQRAKAENKLYDLKEKRDSLKSLTTWDEADQMLDREIEQTNEIVESYRG